MITQELIQWGGWGGYPLNMYFIYNLIATVSSKLLQNLISGGQIFKIFLGHASRLHSKRMLEVVRTLCRLGQHSVNPPPSLNSVAMVMLMIGI